jgi:arsenate reductase
MTRKKRVLFICTHNSARSQMAEGFLRSMAGDRLEVASAGTEQTRVHPLAIAAMADVGVDISGHTSKTLERFEHEPWDYVITVCSKAAESCPVFAAPATHLAWDFEDPSKAAGTEDERLEVFRKVRNEIRTRLEDFVLRTATS